MNLWTHVSFWILTLTAVSALPLWPGPGEAAFARGELAVNELRVSEAVEAFREAIRMEPENPEYRVALACAHVIAGRLTEGESELQKAVHLAPENAAYHFYLGSVLAARLDPANEEFVAAARVLGRVVDEPGAEFEPLDELGVPSGQSSEEYDSEEYDEDAYVVVPGEEILIQMEGDMVLFLAEGWIGLLSGGAEWETGEDARQFAVDTFEAGETTDDFVNMTLSAPEAEGTYDVVFSDPTGEAFVLMSVEVQSGD